MVPGGAAGVSLHPWTQRLPGSVCGLRSAPATAAEATAAASLQRHGECACATGESSRLTSDKSVCLECLFKLGVLM